MIRAWAAASFVVATLVSPCLPSAALAVDVINQDDSPYFLIVVGPDGEEDVVIDARAGLYDVCAGCLIRIDGIGDVRAAADASVLVIKNHKATLEAVPSLSPARKPKDTVPAQWEASSPRKPASPVF